MKKCIILLTLLSLFLSSTHAMDQIDEAIGTSNVQWVESLLNNNNISNQQKQLILKVANKTVKERRRTSQSMFRSPRDLLRLMFGLGVNGFGCSVILCGLIGLGICPTRQEYNGPLYGYARKTLDKNFLTYSLGILAAGGATWLFGLYNTIKGWNMSNAYGKLSNARQIQQMINDINSEKNKGTTSKE